jgi:putative membrane protein
MASMSSSTNKTLRPLEVEIPSTADTARIEPGLLSPKSWRGGGPLPPSRRQTTGSVDMEDYFVGPRDMNKHSKWPFFLRMHGSVLPKMLLPLIVVALWSTLITCISEYVYPLKISNLLLTVLGFVVGLAISFRTSTAYERYAEGRKYWSQMLFVGQNLARTIWVHTAERDGEVGKSDLLAKL